ncbi:MAG: glycosyltransferase family 4 protein [Gammaproteobacteria bacterium]|nr:glycosyltransferase family 4 protein [Gammaproteobacteria bacterium]
MQIGFCLYKYFPFGGIQRDLFKLIDECLRRGHSVRVYVAKWNAPMRDDIEVLVAPVKALTNHVLYERYAGWVAEHLEAHPVDLLVGLNKMPGLDVYYAGDSCYEEKARTQRSAIYRLLPRYKHFARFERAVFMPDSATEILTISDNQTPFFRKHYDTPVARFHALPPGIDRDRAAPDNLAEIRAEFRAEFAVADDEHLLLFLGSGFIKKGLDRALLAVRSLPARLLERTRLMVVGGDNAEYFRRMAMRLGIADRVQFFSGREDVPRFLFGADSLLLPAYDENAGMVILEAMIAGLPILVTGNCGYAHYVAEAGAGLISPMPFEQDRFDSQLVELMTSDARDSWRSNGRALAADDEIYRLAEVAVDFFERFAFERDAERNGERLPGPARL